MRLAFSAVPDLKALHESQMPETAVPDLDS